MKRYLKRLLLALIGKTISVDDFKDQRLGNGSRG